MAANPSQDGRTPAHPIEPLFHDRWSPRSFSGERIPDATLASAFEAARWAPSGYNLQPWRFIVARPGDEAWPAFLGLLNERNRRWAARASALVFVVSQHEADVLGTRSPVTTHSFDAGAAWANFAHQALLLGWHTHGIGGFDREAARGTIGLPDDFSIDVAVAVGRKGALATLHADFHEQEKPNGRRAIEDSVFVGRFGEAFVPKKGTLS